MRRALTAAMMLAAVPAVAQDRPYCPARPGLGTTPCTIEPGRVSLELGLTSWEVDSNADARSDTVVLGGTFVRVGVTADTEVGVAWTAYTHSRTRDRASGAIDRSQGTGDVTIALKHNLVHPGGDGLSIAIQPYITLPTGGAAAGAGDWAAGVVVPLSFDLGHGLSLGGTSELAAAVDGDRRRRHLLASQIVGLGVAVNDQINLTGELEALRDEDPAGHATQAFAALSLAWAPSKDLQLDVGAVAGLNAHSPDLQLYAGVSRRF